MTELPSMLPETGRYAALYRWLNKLRAAVLSLRPLQSHNVMTEATTVGTYRQAQPKGKEGAPGAPLQFKGQWVNTNYDEGDIVICADQLLEIDDGDKAGTFIASQAIVTGDLHPGLEPTLGTADVVLSGDAVDSITITTAGIGYSAAPVITIGGDGTGATAHAVVTGGIITSIVVDTPGSGYTAATVTIGDPDQTQKWDDFALGRWDRHVFRVGVQKIVIDAGRDDPANLSLMIYKDGDNEGAGSIQLDIAALLAIAGAGNFVVKPREWDVCVSDIPMKAIFLSTEAY